MNAESIQNAVKWISGLTASPEIGTVYDGTVVKIVEFGAFINILPKTDGLVHISEISHTRLSNVNDALQEGEKVRVKCIGMDDRGKIKLSIKALLDAPQKEAI